ncbi:MAG: T9SS type A sorting domain-containing protein [Bacteroidota bacterium]
MQQRFTFLLLLLMSIAHPSTAQTVSTLINDPDMNFEAIHWHEDGRIYVADYNNGRLYQVFTDGTVVTLLTGIANAAGGGFGSNGNFYYSALSAGTIHQYQPDGTVSTIASGLSQPTGILESNSPDTLFVGEYAGNSVLKVVVSSGEKIPFVADDGIDGPDAVINDGLGNLLVANFNDNKIHRVTLDGVVSPFATLPSVGFTGYINKVGDDFFVASYSGRRIYKINAEGNVELFAGNGSAGSNDGPALGASFMSPNGVVGNPAGDTLLITDGSTIRMITNFASTTSTASPSLLQNLSLSPNPASQQIQLSYHLTRSSDLTWQIFDHTGKTILADSLQRRSAGQHQIQINLSPLPLGIYFIQVSDRDGHSIYERFLKAE